MSRNRLLIYITALMATAACQRQAEVAAPFDPPLVVEGWIENGGTPVVMVTCGFEAASDERMLADLVNTVIRYAKVSITHDGVNYPLSSRVSDEYTFRNYYTTGDLRGEVGGKYILNVEFKGRKARAETIIPEPHTIESLTTSRDPMVDTLFLITARIHDDHSRDRYYKYFSWVKNRIPGYRPSYFGTFSNVNRQDDIEISVNAGINFLQIMEVEPSFRLGDTVRVKLATMDESAYSFWRQVEQNSTCAVLPAVTYFANVKGNMEGATGYWTGYGITEKEICVE